MIFIKVICCALVGPILLIGGILENRDAEASVNWPSVKGKVTATEVWSNARTKPDYRTIYEARIDYKYKVNGKSYTGDRITFEAAKPEEKSREFAEAVVAKHPKGSRLTVYYKPNKPHVSVLQPGVNGWRWFMPVCGGVMTLFGWGPLVLGGFFKGD